jgi:AraC family transcriptional regulator
MSVTAQPAGVFHDPDVDEQEPDGGVRARAPRAEFPVAETHGIALWPTNRLHADSRGLGWHDAYVSLATETSWTTTLPALPHYCVAYCSHRSATITRQVAGERPERDVALLPRLFGMVPADRSSDWTLKGSPEIQLIYLRRSMVDRLAEDVLGVDRDRLELVPRLGFADGLMEQLALTLQAAARRDDGAGDGLYADHVIRLMALHLVRNHAAGPVRRGQVLSVTSSATPAAGARRPYRMQHVRDLIESALDEDLSLERLAAEAGIGTHAFSAAFVKAHGLPPHRYVVERRVERAKRLLRESDLPVAAIAVQTGFSSQSHLASVFKRAVGLTPGEYQRSGDR